MEAIGQLAAGVAHEFNNLLAVVLTNLDLLGQRDRLSEGELRACVEEARQAAKRGAELTRRMLDYSRLSDASRQGIDITGLLAEVRELAGRTFHRSIDFQVEIEDNLRVHGDRLQLYQAVMNLLINAKDAMPDGGQLTVVARAVDLEERDLDPLPNLASGPHVEVSVCDTGSGMPPGVLARACEPFFTTKRTGEGTGLGLSMARSIAHGHGGELVIESRTGQGTTVRLYLPQAAPTPAPATLARPRSEDPGFSGRALVVDDDPLVSRALSRSLRMLGFDVDVAESGEAGVEELRAGRGEIRLVLLDVVMPGMGGEQALAELRAVDPGVRVVVSSGFTQEPVIKRMLDNGALGFLKKPFEIDELRRVIGAALRRSPTSEVQRVSPPGDSEGPSE
ncbi:MAG: response regulator [Deltaproteobacteria bacterium]|jgi:CheY-like chemotaxis protein|nr:response regulator [Deltaproteobacteria bacterium]